MAKEKAAAEENDANNEEYSTKDELKDEGKFFLKDLARGAIGAGGRLGRGVIQVFRHHPKIEDLEEDVQEHLQEVETAEKE